MIPPGVPRSIPSEKEPLNAVGMVLEVGIRFPPRVPRAVEAQVSFAEIEAKLFELAVRILPELEKQTAVSR